MRLYTSALVAIVLSFLPEKSHFLNAVARHNEDLSWLIEHVDTPFFAYQPENVSAPDALLRTHGNGAYEASAFLQFIGEHYHCLPERTAFLHAHRSSWHSDDMVETLRQMNWSAVTGYMPVHKYYFQPYGTYVRLDGVSDPSRNLQTVLGSNVDAKTSNFTYGQIINATAYEEGEAYHYRQAGDVLFAWLNFFGPAGLGPVPEAIQYYCCAQFVVTKERIQRLPREFYLQAIDYANKGRWTGHFSPSYTRGLVFETLWHIIFGEPAIMPKAPSSELCQHFACD